MDEAVTARDEQLRVAAQLQVSREVIELKLEQVRRQLLPLLAAKHGAGEPAEAFEVALGHYAMSAAHVVARLSELERSVVDPGGHETPPTAPTRVR